MLENKLAIRYAKALFQLAIENKSLDEVYNDCLLLQKSIKENKNFNTFLHNPVIKAGKKNQILESIFSGKINAVTLGFLELIVKKGRENSLDDITGQFVNLYMDKKNILVATLTTAHNISEGSKKKIVDYLAKITGQEIQLHQSIDKELIGGFVINYNDKIMDASIKKKLHQLNKQFIRK
jgi:F-type H+-transporting ATPase subunit delta